jgi:ferritin-like metal-binding protein YciE
MVLRTSGFSMERSQRLKLKSFDDLLVDQLKGLYRAEKQIAKSMAKLAKAANSDAVRSSFKRQAEASKAQLKRLDDLFREFERKPGGKKSAAVQGIVDDGAALTQSKGDPDVVDAGLIGIARTAQHYRIAAYGSAQALAARIGKSAAAKMLKEALDGETKKDAELMKLADAGPEGGKPSIAKEAAAKATDAAKIAGAAIVSGAKAARPKRPPRLKAVKAGGPEVEPSPEHQSAGEPEPAPPAPEGSSESGHAGEPAS